MTKLIQQFLVDRGFQNEPNYQQASAKLQRSFSKSGKSLGIFPYGDYVFIYENITDAVELTQVHEADRAYVNSLYKVPKAFRLTVPNIITLALVANPNQQLVEVVNGATRDMMGGEIHGVWLADVASENLYMPSRSNYILRLAGIPLSNTVANRVDPTNRANDLVAALFVHLVEQKRG